MQVFVDEIDIVGCIPDQTKHFFKHLTCSSRQVDVRYCRVYVAQDRRRQQSLGRVVVISNNYGLKTDNEVTCDVLSEMERDSIWSEP